MKLSSGVNGQVAGVVGGGQGADVGIGLGGLDGSRDGSEGGTASAIAVHGSAVLAFVLLRDKKSSDSPEATEEETVVLS